jgi:phosphoheptose isomerase
VPNEFNDMLEKFRLEIQSIVENPASIPADSLSSLAIEILEIFRSGNKIAFVGNGGSAAEAMHLAAEFTGHCVIDHAPLPAMCLNESQSALTAISNEYGQEYMFSRIVEAFLNKGDLLIVLSTSGTSKNGTHFLSLFFPPGAPLGLAPFLVLIEPVTYIFKVLSLAIRLFANPMSGHTLPKTPSTLGRAAVGFRGILITPLVIISLVTGSETAIGSSQAYTFPVLLRLYTHDAIELH